MIPFIILFVLGRIVSHAIYRMCWSNGEAGKFAPQGAFFTLLRRPLPWLMRAAVMWPLVGLSWGAAAARCFPDLIERFAASLDQRISWSPGEVLEWGAFCCRSVG